MNWQLQQAKQSLSKVVRLAKSKGPQMITQHGVESVWIISAEDYHKLTKEKESLIDFFQRSPHRDIDLKIKRRKDLPRDVEL
jgi:antitoxin Phd